MTPKQRKARFDALTEYGCVMPDIELFEFCLKKVNYTWDNMRRRCYCESYHQYHRYGGRGIGIEWGSKRDFRRQMLPLLYEVITHSGLNQIYHIDRIDNDGNYSSDNCQWVTASVNSSKDNAGTPKSSAHREAMSRERKGKPQTKARMEAAKRAAKKRMKPVLQILNGKVIAKHESAATAAQTVGCVSQNIQEVCSGSNARRKTAGGYGWRYA